MSTVIKLVFSIICTKELLEKTLYSSVSEEVSLSESADNLVSHWESTCQEYTEAKEKGIGTSVIVNSKNK